MQRCRTPISVTDDLRYQRSWLYRRQFNPRAFAVEPPPLGKKADAVYINSVLPVEAAEPNRFAVPVYHSFACAAQAYPGISIDPGVVAGSPCISGTRIPVYMVLDAVEYYGGMDVSESYPRLTVEQIKDAIGFAKTVVECSFGNEAPIASR